MCVDPNHSASSSLSLSSDTNHRRRCHGRRRRLLHQRIAPPEAAFLRRHLQARLCRLAPLLRRAAGRRSRPPLRRRHRTRRVPEAGVFGEQRWAGGRQLRGGAQGVEQVRLWKVVF